VVLEYLTRVDKDQPIPKARADDARLELIQDRNRVSEDDDDYDQPAQPEALSPEIDAFLKGKTKAQLIELVRELVRQYPETGQALMDRQQLTTGDTKALLTRLRKEIHKIAEEPGWRDHWHGEGYTPDYSGIRTKLEVLLKAGHADEVLALGKELITVGIHQVEESHDEGETEMEVADCMPVVVQALDQSSLVPADKLAWAVDVVLKDPFSICEPMAEYLNEQHPKAAWDALADQLLSRLNPVRTSNAGDEHSREFARERLSDWAIHALERAERSDEIIPFCEAEAPRNGSYVRLVERLVAGRRDDDAERYIKEGIRAVGRQWAGIASTLRNRFLEIRIRQENWPAVAAMQVEEFVRHPSRQTFKVCEEAADKVKSWPRVRECLLNYLENGKPPWKQTDWPLPDTGLDEPEANRRERFPMVGHLIEIAIFEKKPDQVLQWYDRLSQERSGWHGVDEDKIAMAVQTHAPDRAVAIWKNKAERLIAAVNPSAYQEAAEYLRKGGQVVSGTKKQEGWDRYMQELRHKHARKIRLIEILDGLEGKPILKKRR
jgi:uncharacterized Zn finger protein